MDYGLVAVVFISMSVQDVFYTASVVLLARAKDWRGALKGGIMDGLGDLTLPFCVVSTGVSWVRYGLSALTLAMLAALLLGSVAGSEVGFYIGRKLDRTNDRDSESPKLYVDPPSPKKGRTQACKH